MLRQGQGSGRAAAHGLLQGRCQGHDGPGSHGRCAAVWLSASVACLFASPHSFHAQPAQGISLPLPAPCPCPPYPPPLLENPAPDPLPACLPSSSHLLPAEEQGKQNIAFICRLMLGDLQKCIDLLVACGRIPEAAFFARTYCPSKLGQVGWVTGGWGLAEW